MFLYFKSTFKNNFRNCYFGQWRTTQKSSLRLCSRPAALPSPRLSPVQQLKVSIQPQGRLNMSPQHCDLPWHHLAMAISMDTAPRRNQARLNRLWSRVLKWNGRAPFFFLLHWWFPGPTMEWASSQPTPCVFQIRKLQWVLGDPRTGDSEGLGHFYFSHPQVCCFCSIWYNLSDFSKYNIGGMSS